MTRHARSLAARSVRAVAGAALVAVALAGCVGIPSSGSVIVGEDLVEQDAGFEYFPLGPVAGAEPADIARGFVDAFTGSANDYEVARQFLSDGFEAEWNPRRSVTVRNTEGRFTEVDDDTVEYSLASVATVDSAGAYRRNSEPAALVLPFDFVQENGEWRISSADDGIVLSDITFRSLFDTHTLYFLDPENDELVPDLRWFATGSATQRIVTTLLSGPPPWLSGAVRTAFPEGTQLDGPSIDVQAGVADLGLTTEALSADDAERQLMQVQLTESLATVPNIRRVSLTVGGTPLISSEVSDTVPQPEPSVDSRALVEREGSVGFVSGDGVASIGSLGEKIADLDAVGATVALEQGVAAVRSSSGVSLVRAGEGAATLLDTRQSLVTPSLDDVGFVWVASQTDASVVLAYSFDGAVTRLATGLPSDADVAAIDISRDGARILIFVESEEGTRLVVKAISRDANADGVPLALSESVLDSVVSGADALDATWVDELTVATLSTTGSGSAVVAHTVGGDRTPLGAAPGAVALVGGNGESNLRAIDDSGMILLRSGSGWTETGVEVGFIATQR
ncbi:LpqB family beta-propeller domain-containing protein [Marisediminicola sp. LYQ134]|uniref:LpqB family beta-propeller domain-containing protein n=1 Tax=unclassified Marisediminicola TaxID=2618316 RepID=UPI0039832B89